MFGAIARKLFGSANDRFINSLKKDVQAINDLEPQLEALDDEALRQRTAWLRSRQEKGETLDALLVDAFATVREAAKRTLGQRHFDVQLMGGIVLHRGMIAEMKTGEGKTLVATLPVYLNGLGGKGAHVVTVNDYLARRDADWMGEIYRFLGLKVGCIVHGLNDVERREQYKADVTYGTNNEFGFDYLRDNMKLVLDEMVQREFNFAIVDEVDSILIDEARTPLIISGPAEGSSDLYRAVDVLIPKLTPEDYEKDEKQRTVNLTEEGTERSEVLLREAGLLKEGTLYDSQNVSLVHHINQSLRAHTLFERDTDYIVKDDKVVIIDEFTGRMMEGRRYSEGLHQALEAKEHVTVQAENQTLASITFQNYFRLYPKLSGMTGTAMTEAGEFEEIYNLRSVEMPTNVAVVRVDDDDEVYRTAREKYDAIVEAITDCQKRQQPVLVGTVSIEKSEFLSGLLKKKKIKHQVLNARYHAQEAVIIAQAGRPGAVTIATNMAGRGTDIQLGGNQLMRVQQETEKVTDPAKRDAITEKLRQETEEGREIVRKAGGLFVLGTERHESRRIDNQLRGRSGRQGDPGQTRFYLSLEDDLMRIFGSERMDGILVKLGLQEGEAIVHPWINKALEKAQQKVEGRNFEIRKQLLKFDDVMNDQRKVIYDQRKEIMGSNDIAEYVQDMRHQAVEDAVHTHIPPDTLHDQWNIEGLGKVIFELTSLKLAIEEWAREEGVADQEIIDRILQESDRHMAQKAAEIGSENMRMLEKTFLLQILDHLWKEHLLSMDHLRQGINLRAYGQRDPLNEYRREAFEMFEGLLNRLRQTTTQYLCHLQIQVGPEDLMVSEDPYAGAKEQVGGPAEDTVVDATFGGDAKTPEAAMERRQPVKSRKTGKVKRSDPSTWGRVPRNMPCPCGSGKKFKHCHGRHK